MKRALRQISKKNTRNRTGLMERMMWKDLLQEAASNAMAQSAKKSWPELKFKDLNDFISSIFVPNNAVLWFTVTSADEMCQSRQEKFGNQQLPSSATKNRKPAQKLPVHPQGRKHRLR
jgi:hypothetical protein